MQDHPENQTVTIVKKAEDETAEQISKEFGYVVEISSTIYKQMDRHIHLLKKVDIRHTMQSWALEAIREKILSEKKGNTSEEMKTKFLKLTLSERLRNYIEGRVNALKATRRSYSKKKWILDAISEKLERDQNNISKLIEEIYSSKDA